MECLKIDWENLDHSFERDEFYESIQAPKWIDFTAPLGPADDHEWFCGKAGCTHGKGESLRQQAREDCLVADVQTKQKEISLQIKRKTDPHSSSAAVKRAREGISSSYSSFSSIKEAFAKQRKALNSVNIMAAEDNKHPLKRSIHVSENQNPNQISEIQSEVNLPPFKSSKILAENVKFSQSKPISVPAESRMISELRNMSHKKSDLDVSKSVTSIAKKNSNLRRSTAQKTDLNGGKSDTKEHAMAAKVAYKVSESKVKRGEALRRSFSVCTTSQSAVTSSVALPSKRPINPARSIRNVQLNNERPALCRPPRLVVRKDQKLGVERPLIPNRQLLIRTSANSFTGDSTCEDDGQQMLCRPCTMVEHNGECESLPTMHENPLSAGLEALESKADEPTVEGEQRQLTTLEEQLENLCLSTPGNKQALQPSGHSEQISIAEKQGAVVHQEDSVCLTNSVQLETVTFEHGHTTHIEGPGIMHNEVLVNDCIQSKDLLVESASHTSSAVVCCQGETLINDLNRQVEKSSTIGTQVFKEPDVLQEKKHCELQPVKDWLRNRGLKRKSSELNFRVNCSLKDHNLNRLKVTSSVAFVSSLLTLQPKAVSSAMQSPSKVLPSDSCADPCKEQHKKVKTTKSQSFKPFRLRTEERGALREQLGLGKKEQPVSTNTQELNIHHALRMPSFGHPFRPQRSTKKLTIPKEPKFHTARTRKVFTTTQPIL